MRRSWMNDSKVSGSSNIEAPFSDIDVMDAKHEAHVPLNRSCFTMDSYTTERLESTPIRYTITLINLRTWVGKFSSIYRRRWRCRILQLLYVIRKKSDSGQISIG